MNLDPVVFFCLCHFLLLQKPLMPADLDQAF